MKRINRLDRALWTAQEGLKQLGLLEGPAYEIL
jgi:hypothetical protein